MAGGAPYTADALYAGAQRGPVQAAFHQMMAVEGDQIHIGAQKVQAKGSASAQADSLTSMITRTGLFEIIKVWETEDARSGHDTVWVNLLARKR